VVSERVLVGRSHHAPAITAEGTPAPPSITWRSPSPTVTT